MEEEKINNKKRTILICSITVVAVILIVGISYAFWQLTKLQEDTNIISSGCFGVSLEGNEAINLTSAYPLKTEEGMKSTPYTFTITNTCSGSANYIVNLESLANTTFQNSSIRVALDNTDKLYSEYTESNKYFDDSVEARTLVSGTLEDNGSVTYDLRMWIDENAPSTEQNKIFASKIVIISGEEGEILDPVIENIETTSTLESITITYQASGEMGTTCKYGIEDGTYDNVVSSATNNNCYITGLTPNTTYYYQICTETGKGSKCEEGSASTKGIPKPFTQADVGKYVSMTPTSTSYTPPSSITGYTGSSQKALNPSELNLWRVIKVNTDGTVEMVSDKVSSKEVYFSGKNGYINLVGGLNTIAAQYTDGKHVLRTRHIGYSNQTETITDTSMLSKTSAPWTKTTSSGWTATSSGFTEAQEAQGAGDIGYTADYNLVNAVYGSMEANNPSGTATFYWLASRRFAYSSSTSWYFYGRYVSTDGSLNKSVLSNYNSGFGSDYDGSCAVRPIIILKSTSEIESGSGTSDSPYILN